MSNSLFEEFDSVSAAQWKQKIQVDLKGADYNKTLITATQEGIDITPFYHRETFGETQPIGTQTTAWKISQRIVVTNASEATTKIKNILARGAESVILVITDENISIAEILADIDVQNIPIHIEMEFLSVAYCSAISAFAKELSANITIGVDNIGNLAYTGNWFENRTKDSFQLRRLRLASHLLRFLRLCLGFSRRCRPPRPAPP